MADPTEYVEVTYKLEMKTKLPRKTHYPGMSNQEIWEHEEDPENARDSLMSVLEDEENLLQVQVKFISDTDDELEEE